MLQSGIPRDEARALLASEDFQKKFLTELSALNKYAQDSQETRAISEGLQKAGVSLVPNPEVEKMEDMTIVGVGGPNNLSQYVLDRAKNISKYIDDNPGQAEGVMFVLAVAQGPKGVMSLVVSQVLSRNEGLREKLEQLENLAGRELGGAMEGRPLDLSNDFDIGLSDGAKLLANLVLGIGSKVGARNIDLKKLPKPGGDTKVVSGANAEFKLEDTKQLGKKFGRHVEDFGGNPANPADREMVREKILEIGRNPEKIIPGKFAGQGGGGANSQRGDVFFRIKGDDVVVTKPDGTFVTILKGGINNLSVRNALRGDAK